MSKKIILVVVLLGALVAVGWLIDRPASPEIEVDGGVEATDDSQSGEGADDHADLIRVTNIFADDPIESPLTVLGEARGNWYFEASFPVQLLDSKGNVIATAVAQAQEEWMTTEFVPFKAVLTFNPVRGSTNGTLVLQKDNPSGLPENDDQLTIPVKLPSMNDVTWSAPGVLPASQIENKQVRITTEKGDIVFKLFRDTAPLAVSNLVYLASGGYYNGVIFHRVEKSPVPFVIQGGDPTGTGRGGPGYQFKDELSDDRKYTRGIVAMANAGANTNGSQFFIMLGDTPLPHLYTIFGEVTSGMDVVDQIKKGDVMISVKVEDLE
jgi:cyclophilin family peptidyl-prolyl cis-trans isomerase